MSALSSNSIYAPTLRISLTETLALMVDDAWAIHSLPLLIIDVYCSPTYSLKGRLVSAATLRYALTLASLCRPATLGRYKMWRIASADVSLVHSRILAFVPLYCMNSRRWCRVFIIQIHLEERWLDGDTSKTLILLVVKLAKRVLFHL